MIIGAKEGAKYSSAPQFHGGRGKSVGREVVEVPSILINYLGTGAKV